MMFSAMNAQSLPSPPEWDLILSASQKNNADAVLRLLNEEGVPPSHSNVVGQTALHIAALWGSVETTEVLINAGANVNAQNQIAKMTPLHCAIRGTFQSFKETHPRRVQCVKLLLQAGADGKICDMKGKDAFECIDDAIRESVMRKMGNIEDEMKEMRVALKSTGLNMSPLGLCINAMDVEGVKRCLGGGEGGTAEGDNTVTQVEVKKGLLAAADKFKFLVDENSTDSGAYKSLSGIIHCLLEAGGDANSHPPISNTPAPLEEAPLHIICSSICMAYSGSATSELLTAADSAADTIRDLLAHGAKIGSVTMALLPMAAHRGRVQSVKFMIETVGVNPNYRGRQGMTSLILASRSGKIDIVRVLLAYETLDMEMSDDAGKKAIDYATANGKEEIVGLLQQQRS